MSKNLKLKSRHSLVHLNELDIVPCQACGEAPSPKFCFFDDDMTRLYRRIEQCDCLLFGSPVYFDAVSAQAKSFIDRCNCMRPPDYDNSVPGHDFVKLLSRSCPGAIVLVGGDQAWFEGARRCIAGFFKWIGVTNEAVLKFSTTDFNRVGEVVDHPETLTEADQIGRKLAAAIRRRHG